MCVSPYITSEGTRTPITTLEHNVTCYLQTSVNNCSTLPLLLVSSKISRLLEARQMSKPVFTYCVLGIMRITIVAFWTQIYFNSRKYARTRQPVQPFVLRHQSVLISQTNEIWPGAHAIGIPISPVLMQEANFTVQTPLCKDLYRSCIAYGISQQMRPIHSENRRSITLF